MKKTFIWWLSIILIISLTRCETQQSQQPLKIAISKAVPTESYQFYIKWLKDADSTIIYFDMYHLGIDSALKVLKECDGLLLTGGEDINPIYYGQEFDSTKCDPPNNYRDSLEFLIIEKALSNKIPVMGVCRGLQILNVYFGGSLIFDIPLDFDTLVKHRYPGYKVAEHEVRIIDGSLLSNIAGVTLGKTNSNHHQGINAIAPLLTGNAFTEDGLIEAIELEKKENKPFVFAVQWHPERMDYTNPLSGKISRRFLKEARTYSIK